MSLDDDLQAWGESRRMEAPTPSEARALVERARRRRGVPLAWVIGGGGLVLAGAAAAITLVLLAGPAGEGTPAPEETVVAVAPDAPAELGVGRHAVEGGEVVIEDGSRVVLGDHGLELRAGALRVVAGEDVDVHVADWTVSGALYTVEHTPFVVRVQQGHARVAGSDVVYELGPGDALQDGVVVRAEVPVEPVVAPSAPVPPKAPSAVEIAKADLLAGRVDAARDALVAHLTQDAADANAWVLLARVETRAGDRQRAAEAWLRVVDHGSAVQAHSARYEAAILLEDQPSRVVELLTPFVEDPGPLAPEAHLRLGRALVALGRVDEGRAHLQTVADGFPGSLAAGKARAALARIPE